MRKVSPSVETGKAPGEFLAHGHLAFAGREPAARDQFHLWPQGDAHGLEAAHGNVGLTASVNARLADEAEEVGGNQRRAGVVPGDLRPVADDLKLRERHHAGGFGGGTFAHNHDIARVAGVAGGFFQAHRQRLHQHKDRHDQRDAHNRGERRAPADQDIADSCTSGAGPWIDFSPGFSGRPPRSCGRRRGRARRRKRCPAAPPPARPGP